MQALNSTIQRVINDKRLFFCSFIIVLLLLSAFMSYCYSPLHGGHDSYFHFRRFNALINALGNGTFPSYIDYDAMFGYGYLVKAFYSDIILIPFAAIALFTSPIFGYQFMIFTMTVICGILTYISVNKIYKNPLAAFLSAILYTFCVYKLLDTFQRGAIGEAFSFAFVPLIFWGLYEIIKGDYRKWYIIAIGYSLMIFTHLLSSVLMFITMIIILIIYYKPLVKEPKRISCLLIGGVVSLILLAYYLYPMLEQMLSDNFYYQSKTIMSSPHDARLSNLTIIQGLFSGIVQPRQLFLPGIGFMLTCTVALRIFVKGKSPILRSLDTGVIIGVVYIIFTSFLIPWNIFPLDKLSFIQFPWRLYEFVSFFFAIAGGYYLSQLLQTHKQVVIGIAMIVLGSMLVIVNDAKYYQDDRSYYNINAEPNDLNRYHLGGFEYLPAKVPHSEYFLERGDSIAIKNETTSIHNFKRHKGITSFDIELNLNEKLELPLNYYKGYKAAVNGQNIVVEESNNGLVEVEVNQPGRIDVWYAGTPVQKISWYITLISILGLCVYIYLFNRKNKKKPHA